MTKQIIDYLNVVANDIHELNSTVKTQIKQGWQPLGRATLAMAVSEHRTSIGYMQTLVKYAD